MASWRRSRQDAVGKVFLWVVFLGLHQPRCARWFTPGYHLSLLRSYLQAIDAKPDTLDRLAAKQNPALSNIVSANLKRTISEILEAEFASGREPVERQPLANG